MSGGRTVGTVDSLLVWVNENLVPQVETTADVSGVVNQQLLQVLLTLGRSELAELTQAAANLEVQVTLSANRAELRALREAADASVYQGRPIDGEVRLTLPAADEFGDWLARGLTAQVLAVPNRWRLDVASALFTLTAGLQDDARSRQRQLVLGLVAAGAGTTCLLWLGLVAAVRRSRH